MHQRQIEHQPLRLCGLEDNIQPAARPGTTYCSSWLLGATDGQQEQLQEELEELLKEGVTPLLSGFMSKKGTPFDARLAINQQNKVVFMFPFTGRTGYKKK